VSGLLAVAAILWWLWTSTAWPPEADSKDADLGLRLPIYVSGPDSVGGWAVWISVLGDATAFASPTFAVSFYWTAQPASPPSAARHARAGAFGLPGAGFAARWSLTVAARHMNRHACVGMACAGLALAALATPGGIAAMIVAFRPLDP